MPENDLDTYCAANQQRHVDELIEFLRIPSISADPAHAADVRRNAEYLAEAARKRRLPARRDHRDGGPPGRLRRAPRRSDAADRAHLRTPRRAAGRPARRVADVALRARGPRRQPLRARRGGRQGPGVDAPQGGRVGARGPRRAAAQPQADRRRRGGVGVGPLRGHRRGRAGAARAPTSWWCRTRRSSPPASRRSAPGCVASRVSRCTSRARRSTCTRAGSAARSPTRSRRSRRSWRRCTTPSTRRVTVPGLLRRRARTLRRGARALRAASPTTSTSSARRRATCRRRSARRDGPTASASGRVRRSSSTASGAATRARARRRSSRRAPAPRSPAGWYPNQDPERIAELVRDAVLAAAPVGVTVTAEAKGGGRPVVTSIDHPAVQAASRAMESVFGIDPRADPRGWFDPAGGVVRADHGIAGRARRPRPARRSDPRAQREIHPRHVLQGHSRARPPLGRARGRAEDVMTRIEAITALEILDSRGNPTLECVVTLNDGSEGRARVPSGASTGVHEAVELRDGDPARFGGKGVLKALANVEAVIGPELIGFDVTRPGSARRAGSASSTARRTRATLGANAILAVSLASSHAAAASAAGPALPPSRRRWARTCSRCRSSTCSTAARTRRRASTSRSSCSCRSGCRPSARRCAPAPNAFTRFARSCTRAVWAPDRATRAATRRTSITTRPRWSCCSRRSTPPATHRGATSRSGSTRRPRSSTRTVGTSCAVRGSRSTRRGWSIAGRAGSSKYPIVSLEDGMAEDDWDGWKLLTDRLGGRVQLVGDDIFVTNTERLQLGIDRGVANSILIKLNQIGTVTETLATIALAAAHNYSSVISHRSGETEDTSIADLAVAVNAGQIKTGAPSRSERVAKYNRLLRIEHELGEAARLRGHRAVLPHASPSRPDRDQARRSVHIDRPGGARPWRHRRRRRPGCAAEPRLGACVRRSPVGRRGDGGAERRTAAMAAATRSASRRRSIELETVPGRAAPVARVTSSGQAALLLATTLVVTPSRPRVVVVRPCYGGTDSLLAGPLGNLGVRIVDRRPPRRRRRESRRAVRGRPRSGRRRRGHRGDHQPADRRSSTSPPSLPRRIRPAPPASWTRPSHRRSSSSRSRTAPTW